ncbi:MAG: peptide deformylase [Gammaproteobacteria bacterium]
MTLLNVLIYPDKRLLKPAQPIEQIDDTIRDIAKNMIETMYTEEGIGLAAPQVGISLRLMTVDLSEEKNQPQVLINPVITERTGEVQSKEGCLSFPDLYIEVPRAEKIHIDATCLDGKPIHIEADGLLSRCLQHEVDHLDGIVFVDRLSPLKRPRAIKKFLKYMQQTE